MSMINTAITAIVAALQSAPAVAVVARVTLRPMAQGVAQQIAVRPLGSESTEIGISGQAITWTTQIAVECYARAPAGTAPDVAVDNLLTAAYARLMADPTLGGAVLFLQPQNVAFDFDVDAEKTACATLVLHAHHRVNPASFS